MATALNYTILAGDTLNAIATGFGNAKGVTIQQIQAVNPETPAGALKVGQVINIPATSGSGPALRYTVLSGDTYSGIAKGVNAAAGVTVTEIEVVNPAVDPNALQIGAVLAVPVAGSTPVPHPSPVPTPVVKADNIGYWAWTWSNDSPIPGATLGIAFSGWADVQTAVQQSARVKDSLAGDKYICIGGGNQDGAWSSAVLDSVNKAIADGTFAGYDGIAYDVEEGDSGLEQAFSASFAAAHQAGFKVLVTVSHSAPYGIGDGGTLMHSFFSDENIDLLSPQLYTTGEESENSYATSQGITWADYANSKAGVAPSIVKASYYYSALEFFKQQGVTLAGFVQWQQA